MTSVQLRNVRKAYGSYEALHDINLRIDHGEFVVFVGPSGCGKSTLLRMIAGLESITGGSIEIGARVVNDIPASKRGIAMVFQSYALYPHMKVRDNMAFGMKIAGMAKPEIDRRVSEVAEKLQLTPYLERLPKALSGGQRQRVAIGRAICRDPSVFLFDEPLSNLDAALRVATRVEIAKLSASMPDTTMIYVTHDQTEAMTLADRIVVLSAGHIEQVGTPLELYERPANLFVAKFIGSPAMNIIPATISATGGTTVVAVGERGGIGVDARTGPDAAGRRASLGIRPEHISTTQGDDFIVKGRISIVEALGEVTLLYVETAVSGQPVVAKLQDNVPFSVGETVRLAVARERIHLFDENGSAFEQRDILHGTV